MRDALSIFDQVVSFCQGNITYQQTIADLNVLDNEYYFKLVDYFLAGDITNIMLTFNDILSKDSKEATSSAAQPAPARPPRQPRCADHRAHRDL
jgi:DNA polymerase III gamma/tau subunit